MTSVFSKKTDKIPIKLSPEELAEPKRAKLVDKKLIGKAHPGSTEKQSALEASSSLRDKPPSVSSEKQSKEKITESLPDPEKKDNKKEKQSGKSESLSIEETEENVTQIPVQNRENKDAHHTEEKAEFEKEKLKTNVSENSQVDWYAESQAALEDGRKVLDDLDREKDAVMKTTKYQSIKNYLPKILNEFKSIPNYEELEAYKVFHNYPDSINL